jgi:hypothetical protein
VKSQISARDKAIDQMFGVFKATDASHTEYKYYTIFERLFPSADRKFGKTDDADTDCIPAAVSIISTVPRTPEEYKQVFRQQREPTAANVEEMRNAEQAFRDMDPQTNFNITSTEEFTFYFTKLRSPFIAIVGHNDGGSIITKHNGMVNINDANKLCYSRLKLCLFISCYAAEYLNNDFGSIGLKDEISIRKAVNVTQRAIVYIITNTMFQRSGCLKNPFRTVQDLEALFPEPRGYDVLYLRTGGWITGGVILIMSLIADSDR